MTGDAKPSCDQSQDIGIDETLPDDYDEIQALITPDPNYVIQKTEYQQYQQLLEQIGYPDASKLENRVARAIHALAALNSYTPAELKRIADSGAGQGFQVAQRLDRLRQLCAHFAGTTDVQSG